MNLELAQYIASHRRNYPRGIPVSYREGAQLKVVFVSAKPLLPDEIVLVEGAAERGLKFAKADYVIGTASDIPQAAAVVLLGEVKLPSGFSHAKIIKTHSAKAVLGDPAKKREFWESIKVLTGQ